MSSSENILFFGLLSVLTFAAFSGEPLLYEIKILICYFITIQLMINQWINFLRFFQPFSLRLFLLLNSVCVAN